MIFSGGVSAEFALVCACVSKRYEKVSPLIMGFSDFMEPNNLLDLPPKWESSSALVIVILQQCCA